MEVSPRILPQISHTIKNFVSDKKNLKISSYILLHTPNGNIDERIIQLWFKE